MASAFVALVVLPSFAPDAFALACPHHAGHGEHASGGADESGLGASSGHGASDPHEPAASGLHVPETGAPPPPPCTCAGQCPVSGAPTLVATTHVTPLVRNEIHGVRVAPTPRIPSARRPAYLHPPANAPPLG